MIEWDDALKIIESRDLEKLTRSEDQIKTYLAAKERFTASHGGVAQFVTKERLQWDGPRSQPVNKTFLGDPRDIHILLNDFPYDFAPNMTHVVVWCRARCPCTEDQFPTPESRKAIEAYLEQNFMDKYKIDRDDIAWFKNTVRLQSVPSLEHFHVLVRNAPSQMLDDFA